MKRVGQLGKAIFDTVTTRRRDDAIAACTFLVSYPRSGNTWLRYLLANLIEPTTSWNLTNINDIVPDMYEVLDWSNSKPGTIIKSHQPYTANYPKVIYLYKDGRDVSISYFDYSSKVKGYTADLTCFLREFLKGSVTFALGKSTFPHGCFEIMRCLFTAKIQRSRDRYRSTVRAGESVHWVSIQFDTSRAGNAAEYVRTAEKRCAEIQS